MKLSWRALFILALLLLAAGAYSLVSRWQEGGFSEDHPAANTSRFFAVILPDVKGTMRPMSDLRGQILVVNFWASWCPPCREEMPELSELQTMYQDKGLLVLGIAAEDQESVNQFASEAPVGYPLLAADTEAGPLSYSLGNHRSVLPYTVVIDRDGHIVKTYFGRITRELLEQTIKPLLQASNAP
jgi:thiol-disulfide isomerase/thioredoxin